MQLNRPTTPVIHRDDDDERSWGGTGTKWIFYCPFAHNKGIPKDHIGM